MNLICKKKKLFFFTMVAPRSRLVRLCLGPALLPVHLQVTVCKQKTRRICCGRPGIVFTNAAVLIDTVSFISRLQLAENPSRLSPTSIKWITRRLTDTRFWSQFKKTLPAADIPCQHPAISLNFVCWVGSVLARKQRHLFKHSRKKKKARRGWRIGINQRLVWLA